MSNQHNAGKKPASKVTGIPSIRIPKAVDDSLNASPRRADFSGEGMTGAQVFANLCKDEGLPALFCAAGSVSKSASAF